MSYTLLIADDERMERMALRLLIANAFPDITILSDACNGIELVQRARETKIDIAIVDIEMPGLNGIDAIRILRQSGQSTKVVIFTAYSKFDYAVDALKLDAEDYLLKPMRREQIEESVRKCINRLDEERMQDKASDEQLRAFARVKPAIANEFILSVIADKVKQSNIDLYVSLLGVKPENGRISVLRLKDALPMTEREQSEIYPLLHARMTALCPAILSVSAREIVIYTAVRQSLNEQDAVAWMRASIGLMLQLLRDIIGRDAHAGISGAANGILRLHGSYKEACAVLETPGADDVRVYRSRTDDKRYSPALTAALNYIRDNYTRDISLDMVAEQVGVSTSHLSRLFNQESGVNFSDCLANIRIDQAKALILSGENSTKKLSEKVGFNSDKYFCHTFKKLTGFTVSEFKSRNEINK